MKQGEVISMDMQLAEMQKNLKMLRLHGMNATLQTRLIQANQGAAFAEVFASLIQDEMDSRNSIRNCPKKKSMNWSAASSSGTATTPC
jgi:hypothetical protein